MTKVVITQRIGHAPPIFKGRCNDEPITIRLDSSAMLHLAGGEAFDGTAPLSASKVRSIEEVAARLVMARQIDSAHGLSVSISALDLD